TLSGDAYRIIPRPTEIEPRPGSVALDAITQIVLSDVRDSELQSLASFARRILQTEIGIAPRVSPSAEVSAPTGALALLLKPDATSANSEQYMLSVGPTSVTISAPSHVGLFYGLQTLRQLLPVPGSDDDRARVIPAVEIRDKPRFGYRGMHLDVARHFFPVEFVKRYIDLLAMYKMNTFHWHLTEDQGWRIEIQKYPRLTEIGSCRKETILEKNFDPYVGDGTPYCGFYTQDEIREVVDYARQRYVTIIPEIEMPGHSTAALAAYPELACTEGPFEVATVWGVHPDIYCPTDVTFAFLEDVLAEVMDLFPGSYIHVGGDEAPKTRWEESEVAQGVIRREGLADEHELQSYFIRRIERFLNANGRRLIGWDEILEGGLAPEATVMSWRGVVGGIAAAKQGHDVIMTPYSHVYFDYYQGDPAFEPLAIGGYTPLEKVYAFEPVPQELTAAEARHVLGAQGNVWTEYMKTPGQVEYMAVPRMLALSEVVWSPPSARDWSGFSRRLAGQFARLDRLGINYRIPHVSGLERDRITLDDHVTIRLRSHMMTGAIHYTTDETDPTPTSPRYEEPVILPVDPDGVTITARVYLPDGRASAPRSTTFRKTRLRPAARINPRGIAPGLRYRYYEIDEPVSTVNALSALTPIAGGIASDIELQPDAREEQFGLVFTGYVRVPLDGLYTFFLSSDDGSRLLIGDDLVVDHDGPHGATEREGMIALQAGYHAVTVLFFQGGGDGSLSLTFAREDDDHRTPVVARFFHEQ
ncbi:MAG: family 20 glycosylhydrolase, partial [Gemmatimonadota bacterium]|nr:family 20 glycosylhydrolase [Gemmatimonadota bacterium]